MIWLRKSLRGTKIRIHLGDVSYADFDEVSRYRFDTAFELSDDMVITPKFDRSYTAWIIKQPFPWFLGVAPIDYQSRLAAELTRVWGGFDKREEDDVIVGEVDGIEICRPVTVYRRGPTA